jgi:hypothetical protein
MEFARTINSALVLMTGSSADLRRVMFVCSRGTEYSSYPDFNKSMSDAYTMPALRTCEELAAYLRARYPHQVFDAPHVALMLHCTGGVGRAVHDYQRGARAFPRSFTPSANADAGGRESLAVLVHRMLLDEGDDGPLHRVAGTASPHDVVLTPAQAGLHFIRAVDELRIATSPSDADARALIRLWQDRGLVYVPLGPGGEELEVQLARPADAHAYLTGGFNAADFKRVRSVCAMLSARDGRGPVAGYDLEDLVLPRLHKLVLGDTMAADGTQIRIAAGVLEVQRSGIGMWALVTVDVLQELSARRMWVRWIGEIGIDGIRFLLNDEGGRIRVTLRTWQSKGDALTAFSVAASCTLMCPTSLGGKGAWTRVTTLRASS